MTIDYSQYLNDEQKRSILTQRVQQFAAEAYQHEINKKLAVETGNDVGVTQADDALAILGTAIQLHQDELNKLSSAE